MSISFCCFKKILQNDKKEKIKKEKNVIKTEIFDFT